MVMCWVDRLCECVLLVLVVDFVLCLFIGVSFVDEVLLCVYWEELMLCVMVVMFNCCEVVCLVGEVGVVE